MKHKLQWKIVGIMFVSMFCGVTAMGIVEMVIFEGIYHLTPEVAEKEFAAYSPFFNLIFLIMTIVVFFLCSRKIIKRIEIMNDNVKKIAAGEMSGLMSDRRKDELGSLASNINTMAEKIAHSIQKEQNMVCNIAHDLRTPITSIKGYVELLQKDGKLDLESRNYTDILSRKTDELAVLVNELLEYSILTFQEKEYEQEEVALGSLLEQVIIDYIPQMEQAGLTFTLKGNEKPHYFQCNKQLMIRLFENLLTNSIRYGKSGKVITINIFQDKQLHIDFINEGAPLSEHEKSHLFEAFYQGESAKAYQTESKGLGLAIAKEIVGIHQGTIEVLCDYELNKVCFRITFPIVIVNKL